MGDNVSDNTVESASASATENASENKSDSATEVKSDGATESDKKIELDSKSSKTLEINLGASPKKEEPKKEPAPAPAPKVVVVDAPKKEEPKKEEPKVVVVEKPKKEPAPAPPVKDDAAINKALMSIYDQLKALSDTTVAQQNEIRQI